MGSDPTMVYVGLFTCHHKAKPQKLANYVNGIFNTSF